VTINEELEAAADAWQALAEEAVAAAPKQLSSEARRQALREALTQVDVIRLAELTKKLSGMVEQMLANPLDEAAEVCDADELAAIMAEQVDMQEIEDLLKLRYQLRRARIFAHITATHIQDAVSDPDYAPGEVAVPSLGRKFTREGGSPKLKLDEEKLRGLLAPEDMLKVFKTEVKTTITLDHDALVKLIATDPELMDVVRQCIISVGHTPSSFHVRNL
jgi:hypothetical protein